MERNIIIPGTAIDDLVVAERAIVTVQRATSTTTVIHLINSKIITITHTADSIGATTSVQAAINAARAKSGKTGQAPLKDQTVVLPTGKTMSGFVIS